jgi:outer membrane protein OmpA-like peptidoglycan-associated protein
MAGYELDATGDRKAGEAAVATREKTAPVKERTGKTLIRGAVHDVDDKPVPGATVTLRGGGLARALSHTGSTFNFPVEEGEYTLTAEAEGFYARGVHVSIATGEQQVFSLPLKPTAKEQVVELTRSRVEIHQSIQFESKKARILPESFFILDAVADLLLRHPELKQVRVEGHTDNVGNAEVNQTLSENRAQSVVKYLVEAGVDPTRLQAQGFGASKPIADNKSESGRAKNRRVQFELVGR